MHMTYDDKRSAFTSHLSDARTGRHVEVSIPTGAPAEDFTASFNSLKRLSEASDYVFQMISSGLEDVPAENALQAVSILSNTLVESRFSFGQLKDDMPPEQICAFEDWMSSFAAMVADLKSQAPADILKHMYCHRLTVGNDICCHYRFEGFEGDVMEMNIPMQALDAVLSRMIILPGQSASLSSTLH